MKTLSVRTAIAAVLVTRLMLSTSTGARAEPAPPGLPAPPPPPPATSPPPPAQAQQPPELPRTVADFLSEERALAEKKAQEEAQRALEEKVRAMQLGHTRAIGSQAAARSLASAVTDLVGRISIPGPPLDTLPEIAKARALHVQAQARAAELAAKADAVQQMPDDKVPEAVAELQRIRADVEALVAQAQRALNQAMYTLRSQLASSRGLVVSGGVSLGSHQAGFLYYYTQRLLAYDVLLRQMFPHGEARESFGRFQLATGASAGSINAFLALLTGCMKPVPGPERSLFYRSWIDVGIRELVKPKQVTFDGVFSRDGVDAAADRIRDVLDGHPDDPALVFSDDKCVAHLGITATRLEPRSIAMPENTRSADGGAALALRRQTEKLIIQLTREERGPVRLAAFRPRDTSKNPTVDEIYPTLSAAPGVDSPAKAELGSRQLMGLLQASSAFPLAFAPKPVGMTIWQRSPDGHYTRTEETVRVTDGGFLDNTPLRLAVRMRDWVDAVAQQQQARRQLDPEADGTTLPPVFLFMNSESRSWLPAPKPPAAGAAVAVAKTPLAAPERSLLGEYVPFLFGLINNASDAELMDVLENHNDIRRELPRRGMPIAGEQLGHFFAFTDVAFRRFDFYQGMVDAFMHVTGQERGTAEIESQVVKLDSNIFPCFLAYRRQAQASATAVPEPKDIPLCAPLAARPADRNLLVLLKVSARYRAWAQTGFDADKEFGQFLGLLDDEKFEYTDLRAFTSHPDRYSVPVALRELAQDMVQRLGEEQDSFSERWAIWIPGKIVPNRFSYYAPSYWSIAGDVTGGLELALGATAFRRPSLALRFVPGLRIFDVHSRTLPNGSRYTAAGLPFFGMRLEASGQTIQTEFGVGVAAKLIFVPYDKKLLMWRWGPEATLAFTLYQRLSLSVGVTRYIDPCSDDAACNQVTAFYRKAGAESYDPMRVWNLEARVGIGWRFIF